MFIVKAIIELLIAAIFTSIDWNFRKKILNRSNGEEKKNNLKFTGKEFLIFTILLVIAIVTFVMGIMDAYNAFFIYQITGKIA